MKQSTMWRDRGELSQNTLFSRSFLYVLYIIFSASNQRAESELFTLVIASAEPRCEVSEEKGRTKRAGWIFHINSKNGIFSLSAAFALLLLLCCRLTATCGLHFSLGITLINVEFCPHTKNTSWSIDIPIDDDGGCQMATIITYNLSHRLLVMQGVSVATIGLCSIVFSSLKFMDPILHTTS